MKTMFQKISENMSEEGSYQMKNMSDGLIMTSNIINTTEYTNSSLYRQLVGILGQHVNQESQLHEVLMNCLGPQEDPKSHLVEVTVVQLSIPLYHEIHHQNSLGEVQKHIHLHSTSSQKLNTENQNQHTAKQARERAETHRNEERQKTKERKRMWSSMCRKCSRRSPYNRCTSSMSRKWQRGSPPQEMHKFNVQKMTEGVPHKRCTSSMSRKLQRGPSTKDAQVQCPENGRGGPPTKDAQVQYPENGRGGNPTRDAQVQCPEVPDKTDREGGKGGHSDNRSNGSGGAKLGKHTSKMGQTAEDKQGGPYTVSAPEGWPNIGKDSKSGRMQERLLHG